MSYWLRFCKNKCKFVELKDIHILKTKATMEANEIIEKIQVGLKKYAEKYSISAKDIGVNIGKKISNGMLGRSESLLLTLMIADKKVESDITLANLLNINPAIEMLAKPKIVGKLNEIGKRNSLNNDSVNATIYTNDLEFTPSLRLYEQMRFIKEITIEEIIN